MNRLMTSRRGTASLLVVAVSLVLLAASATATDQPQRTRRVFYNFDGDSCLSTKAGGKGPVPVNVDDVKRLIEEVAYEGSQVDTILVCVNAQVMYYPTKVGTMRGTLSTAEAVKRYDCDGIELDFNRFPTFFKDGTTEERVTKMNSLVERIRQMLDDVGQERGRRLVLSVRPPSNGGNPPPTPEAARQRGCDVPAWVRNGWVDFVGVSEFLFERGDLPIDHSKSLVRMIEWSPSVIVYSAISPRGIGISATEPPQRNGIRHIIMKSQENLSSRLKSKGLLARPGVPRCGTALYLELA